MAAAIALISLNAVKIRHILISAVIYLLLSLPIYFTMLINVMDWEYKEFGEYRVFSAKE